MSEGASLNQQRFFFLSVPPNIENRIAPLEDPQQDDIEVEYPKSERRFQNQAAPN